jgi:mannose-1-phosphate guanylyltransferase/mannose-6-phosphate isomerase
VCGSCVRHPRVFSLVIRPVILSGGGGTRLWPLSRSGHPKQFHRLFGDQSLLQSTVERCRGSLFLDPLISTADEQRFYVLEQLEELDVRPAALLLEPMARNTAPAIAVAAYWALARGEDAPLLVVPSDHMIQDVGAFHQTVEAAFQSAVDGNLLTFGIRPTGPSTGYGYIRTGDELHPGSPVRKVEQFIEKPDAVRARELLLDGGYLWNGGIFLFRPSAFLEELRRHAPDVANDIEKSMVGAMSDGSLVRPNADAFGTVRNISVDYAVMEQSDKVLVMPATFDWSDVGSWDAVHDLSPADERGNVLIGDVLAIDVSNSLIRSEADVSVAILGLDGIACVATNDAVFIAPLERAQDVKLVVEKLRERGHRRADAAACVRREWGSYETLSQGEGFLTSLIVVKPGAALRPRKQSYRSSHWIVVNGAVEVTVGDQTTQLRENDSIFIPAGTMHRLANPSEEPLQLIEVSCGPNLGEDDIV